MKRCLLLVLVLAAIARAASAELTDDARGKLTEAFDKLAAGQSVDPTTLLPTLSDAKITDGDWRTFTSTYFARHGFTPAMATFWQQAINQGGANAGRYAVLSALTAAMSLKTQVNDLRSASPSAYDSAVASVRWLNAILAGANAQQAQEIGEGLRDALRGNADGVVPLSGNPPVSSPQVAWLGAQLGLTLLDYAVAAGNWSILVDAVNFRGGGAQLWSASGVLLLDNSALTGQHVASLGSLLGAIPRGLHEIRAFVFPPGLGQTVGNNGLALASGQLIYLSAIPMSQMGSFADFLPMSFPTPAPEFTLEAAQQVIRAVQAVQFSRRPELRIRRDAILSSAQGRPDAYLRNTVAPSIYLRQPEELLPQVAYLYFMNSKATFQSALDLYYITHREGLDQFLLMADLLSGGGDGTVLIVTDPAGRVVATPTAVTRTRLTPTVVPWQRLPGMRPQPVTVGVSYVTGIVIGGQRWGFDIGANAVVLRGGPH